MKQDVKDTKEKVGQVEEKVDEMKSDMKALKGQRPRPSKYKVFLTL